ncbi:MAG TPA: carbohydrate-binding protein, partial [Methanoregulaceae archaeon]|nr:carbohydrate-binding protein [Methanoregulaceae archaeon]
WDLDYSGTYPYSIEVPATEWETVEVTFGASPLPTPSSGPFVRHQLPCRIEAEDYDLGGANVAYMDTTPGNAGGRYRRDDVDIEMLGDGSGYAVAYTRTGEWLQYTVSSGSTGTYDMRVRVSSPYEGSLVEFSIDGQTLPALGIPDTGSFHSYAILSVPVQIPAGEHQVRMRFTGAGQNCDYFEFVPHPDGGASPQSGAIRAESSPSGASVLLDGVIVGITPMTIRDVIPGVHRLQFTKRGWESTSLSCRVEANRTVQLNLTLERLVPTPFKNATLPCSIEAEHFNLGGEGIGFHDVDWWNLGGQFRNEGVDIESAPGEGNYKVAWIRTGEWLGYTIRVPDPGRYRLALIGCALDDGASVTLELDGNPGPVLHLPWSRDYDRFGRIETELDLPGGVHVLRLTFAGRQNLDRIDLALAGQHPTPITTPTPHPVVATHLPARIQAEDYDAGPDGVTHHDTTPGNGGGVYRNDSVDILTPSPGASPVVSSTGDGEWLRYTVLVDSPTLFRCTFRLAGTGLPASLSLAVDDEPRVQVTAPLNGTATGFSTHTRTVGLSPGIHQLNLSFNGNLSIDYLDFQLPYTR